MKINVSCPSCSAEFEVGSSIAPWGTETPCPKCGERITVPSQPIGPGLEIGGFKILKLIGEGGMGQVFLAQQLSMNREVALKVMRHRMTLDEEPRKRFLNEVNLVAMLNHPNIVTAFEAGEQESVCYMAMEYVPGKTLTEYIEEHGSMSEADTMNLLSKIAEALQYAWVKHHLLHRDVKPSNIMLDERGEPKLLDMGLSKIVRLPGEVSTASMIVVGSPHYMSPEQAHAAAGIDTRADMYGLGATAFHMITGHVPFEGRDPIPFLLKRIQEEIPNPRDWNRDISKPCCMLLQRLLAKQPDDRYDDWESLIEDMKRVADGTLPAAADPAQPPKQNNMRTMIIAGLAVFALCATLAWKFTNRGSQYTPPPQQAIAEPPDSEITLDQARAHIQQVWPGQENNLHAREDGWHFEITGAFRTTINDLTPLKGFPLSSLDLRNSNVTNMQAVAGMTGLTDCKGGFIPWNQTLQELLKNPDLNPAQAFAQSMITVPAFRTQAQRVSDNLKLMQQCKDNPTSTREYATKLGDKHYLLWLEPKTWDEANLFCQQHGGQLASLSTYEISDAIGNAFGLEGGFIWMGAHQKDGTWSWSDGSTWQFSNWGQGSDATNAAGTFGARAKWKALDHNSAHPFLIQW